MAPHGFEHLERQLDGSIVALRPMRAEHAEALFQAALLDRSSYRYTTVPSTLNEAEAYVALALEEQAKGTVVPFVLTALDTGEVIGTSRFLNLRWYFDRTTPDLVEIGGTWLRADVQRTGVNTEAKLLLLTLAFEDYEVFKVDLKTDARNDRSARAMERIGATFEGILRQAHASLVIDEVGQLRDSAMYAVLRDDWPRVREILLELTRKYR